MADPIAIIRARNLLLRHQTTTGYYRWSAHNPPPAMDDLMQVLTDVVTEWDQQASHEPPRDAAPDPFADDGRMVEL